MEAHEAHELIFYTTQAHEVKYAEFKLTEFCPSQLSYGGAETKPKHIQNLSEHKAQRQQPLQRLALHLRGLHLRWRNRSAMAGATAPRQSPMRPLVLAQFPFRLLLQIHRRPHQQPLFQHRTPQPPRRPTRWYSLSLFHFLKLGFGAVDDDRLFFVLEGI